MPNFYKQENRVNNVTMLFRLELEDDPVKKKTHLVSFTHTPTIHMQEIEYCLDGRIQAFDRGTVCWLKALYCSNSLTTHKPKKNAALLVDLWHIYFPRVATESIVLSLATVGGTENGDEQKRVP